MGYVHGGVARIHAFDSRGGPTPECQSASIMIASRGRK